MKVYSCYGVRVFCVVFFSLTINAFAGAKLEFVTVETKGVGDDSAQEAINAAITEAIGQVNGKSVAATNAIAKKTLSISDGTQKSRLSSTEMQRAYSEATNGVVDSYQVLSETRNERGQFVVIVRAKIAKLKLSASASRLKIALIPFSGIDGAEVFSRNFSNSLGAKLVGSRRFTVLDRQNMSDIISERDIAKTNPLMSASELARLGSTLGADYILVGQVEDVDSQVREVYFSTINRTFEVPEGKASISYKIIDVATSQIKFSDNAILGFDQSSFEKLMGSGMKPNPEIAMAEIASAIIGNKILDSIYPVIVVGVDRGVVTLNQGGDLVEQGAIYGVYERGEKIYDPYTKESLGRAETKVAEIKVERVTAKMSSASLIKGDPKIFEDLKIGKYVCRLEKAAESSRATSARQVKKRIKDKKTVYDDDW